MRSRSAVPGVQQHLNRLDAGRNWCSRNAEAGGVGRPALRWTLTERALDTVSGYARATHGDADRFDPPQSGRRGAGDRHRASAKPNRAAHYRAAPRRREDDEDAKLKRLAQLRSDEGYMAEVERVAGSAAGCSRRITVRSARQRAVVRDSAATNWNLFRELLGSDSRGGARRVPVGRRAPLRLPDHAACVIDRGLSPRI